jgi:tRNA uridine 5-carboxymethylaminomethyl modification enzyme
MKANEFDCIVVGGGHAGAEAAHAAAKMGVKTCLITLGRDSIARMSCNPAIGGLGKGQIAREVDALGGLMGLATDATAIQFKMLNRSKGPAVQSPRAQTDKYKYSKWMREALEATSGLEIVEGLATDIVTEADTVRGVQCADGSFYRATVVIVTTGTFLRGVMHIGSEQFSGGRIGEPASNELSDSLARIGLELGRLKTGTPVRLDAKTVDFASLEAEYGDEDCACFSFLSEITACPRIPCWVTYTNEAIHKLLRDNMERAPLYSGQIKSTGPRYCPSIETKIVRFGDKERHQVFLEPEDAEIRTIYCNGISTSVPKDVQEEMIRLMRGTERAKIVHYAYAIEYDFCPPEQLKSSLETKKIAGLFLAGQINGTSGYEEAAAQGIMAGINAARKLQGREAIVLGRDQAYTGVMIDDLLTRGIDEPYRMFTSRAEYRLILRADNADRRLTEVGRAVGLADDARWQKYQEKVGQIDNLKAYLQSARSGGMSLWEQLRQPKNELAAALGGDKEISGRGYGREVIEAAIIDAKYEGYVQKQQRLAESLKHLENKRIPESLDYGKISHLRAEAREQLSRFRPATLAQAGRIRGITPADITVVQVHLKKYY